MQFPNTNLNLYKSFIAVYETGNTLKACEHLGISSQSTVSHNILQLEKQLNVKLFKSHPRGMTPTRDGEELYWKMKPYFDGIFVVERNVGEFTENSEGVIRIACTTNFVVYFLAKHIAEFRLKYPKVKFEITKITPQQTTEVSKNNDVDIVISTLPVKLEDLTCIYLCTQESIFFTSNKFAHDNKLQSIISKEIYDSLPFVGIDGYVKNENLITTVGNQEMVFQMVIQGIGIGWCLDNFLNICHPDTSIFKFKVEDVNLESYDLNCFYYKKYLTKAVTTFIQDVKLSLGL